MTEFTSDWVSSNTKNWREALSHLIGLPMVRGLEIGSYEGRSSCWFADHILTGQGAKLDCVDTWRLDSPSYEARFDQHARTRPQIQKHRSKSFDWLIAQHANQGSKPYDFIYVDGNHGADFVLTDLTLCWPLLRPGGILICDDYLYRHEDPPTKLGIDSFFACRSDWHSLHSGYQLIVRKSVGIEAVVVSVNYGDFLSHTLPTLARHVDRVVVVSSEEDSETASVVRGTPFADLVVTDKFTRRGECFNKGAAINVGLKNLSRKGWVLLTDADIAYTQSIPILDGSPQTLWGAERQRVVGPEQFDAALRGETDQLQTIDKVVVRDGYAPCGYFQLWHWPTSSHWLPESNDDASRYDMQFAQKWPALKRRELQNYSVLHLETPDNTRGANWRGRFTDRFDQEANSEKDEKQVAVNRGVLTAASAHYWPVLRLLTQATLEMNESISVVDHGLTEKQKGWLDQQGVQILDIPVPETWATLIRQKQRISPTSAPEAWIKPWICQNSPYEHTVWIDADAVPLRGLHRMFRFLERGPWLTLGSWVSDLSSRKTYEPLVNAAYGGVPDRFENAHRINSGVFGFRRGDQWISDWWAMCCRILLDDSLFNHCRLRDQAAIITCLCDESFGPELRIQMDRGLNWPVNGLQVNQSSKRKRYRWQDKDLLGRLQEDHPGISVIHWLGRPKPWQMN